jgi:Tol biopolymer transport system component
MPWLVTMALDPGTRLGPYEILAPAGAGGMGEVYRARDARLDRIVAVKVLQASSRSPQALERFEREAKAIAALHHPGICAIYDVGTAPVPFLVMEFLEGETLHQRLQRGPFEIEALVETALTLADALAAAHSRGIIHRDLKPANVILASHGPKIVDFGLARMAEAMTVPVSGATTFPTRTTEPSLTDPGVAVGTVSYMSPEQLRGEALDARSDLFSLGLVLYEMATGQRAFAGATNAVISAAILHDEPVAPQQVRTHLPARLAEAIRNLLEKDRDVRTQTAAELRAELTRLKRERAGTRGAETSVAAAAAPPPPIASPPAASSSDVQLAVSLMRRHPGIAMGLIAVVLAVTAAAFYFQRRDGRQPSPDAVLALSIADLEVTSLTTSGTADLPAITPDGHYMVYVEHGPSGDSLRLRQTATDSNKEILPPQPGVFLRGASVSPDGVFVYYARQMPPGASELWRIPLLGGTGRRVLARAGAVGFSPSGDRMAFTRAAGDSQTELVVAGTDGTNARVVSTRSLPERFWAEGPNNSLAPAWSPDGRTIAVLAGGPEGGQIVLFDVASGTHRVLDHGPPLIGSGLGWLDDETLLVSMLDRSIAPLQLWLVRVSDGAATRLTNDVNQYVGVSLTRDRNAAVTARTESSFSVWTSDAAGQWTEAVPPKPMKGSLGFALRWLGDDLAYVQSSSGGFGLYRWHADTRSDELLAPSAGSFSASRDGSTILFFDYDRTELGRLSDAGQNHFPRDYMSNASIDGFQLLPDGRRFVVVTRSGDAEVLEGTLDSTAVRTVTNDRVRFAPAVSGGRTEVSPDGRLIAYPSVDDNRQPVLAICDLATCSSRRTVPAHVRWRWMPDSEALLFLDSQTLSNLWVQRLDGGAPRPLTQFPADGRQIWDFDWSADGKRLAVARALVSTNIMRLRGLAASRPPSK